MEERNLVVDGAAQILLSSPFSGVDEETAHRLAQDGLVRLLAGTRSGGMGKGKGKGKGKRPRRPGKVAGGHTRRPRLVAERCSEAEDDESESECDPMSVFRTINGECNNME